MPWSTHVTIMTKLNKIVSLHRKNIKIKIAFYNVGVRTFKFNDVLNWIVFQLTPLNTWGTARLSPIKSSSNGDRSCNRCNQNKRPKTWVLISSMKWGNVTVGQSLNSLPFESIFSFIKLSTSTKLRPWMRKVTGLHLPSFQTDWFILTGCVRESNKC